MPQLVTPGFVAHALSLLPSGRIGLIPWLSSPDLSDAPALVELASLLIGGPVTCFGTTFIVKAPGPAGIALWHQDGYPWEHSLGINAAVTLWVALDDASVDNGALTVIPGSQVLPAQPLVHSGSGLFGAGMDPQLVGGVSPVVLTMAAGDVSAHHPQLIHGSPANTSDSDRRALVLRYRPAS